MTEPNSLPISSWICAAASSSVVTGDRIRIITSTVESGVIWATVIAGWGPVGEP